MIFVDKLGPQLGIELKHRKNLKKISEKFLRRDNVATKPDISKEASSVTADKIARLIVKELGTFSVIFCPILK